VNEDGQVCWADAFSAARERRGKREFIGEEKEGRGSGRREKN